MPDSVQVAGRPRTKAQPDALRAFLREYYGKRLQSAADLTEKACCTDETQRRHAKILELIPEEVRSRHYGCGCPLPEDDLGGLAVLDLGSGAGVDAFVASYLVGPQGHVVGIDMTDEQLEVARRNAPIVARRFGYGRPNTVFRKGFIETADGVADASMDLVISDCVVNLSPRKGVVLETASRVLREGGELYVSDVVADRRVPEELRRDPKLVAECIGGAEYEHDWLDLLRDAGFTDPRVVSRKLLRSEVRDHPISFWSLTIRAFKFSRRPLDRRCEDYGQVAVYRGSLDGSPARFVFDDHHVFEAARPTAVCRNTARMLSETRLGRHFDVTPEVRHFGLFPCGPAPSAAPSGETAAGGACC